MLQNNARFVVLIQLSTESDVQKLAFETFVIPSKLVADICRMQADGVVVVIKGYLRIRYEIRVEVVYRSTNILNVGP